MTPRAPVVLRCTRRNGKVEFVTRQRVRANPRGYTFAPDPDQVRAAEDRARATKEPIDPNLIWSIAAYLGETYGRRLGEDIGSQVMAGTAEAALRNYDVSRGAGLMAYMRYRAHEIASRAGTDDSDPVRTAAIKKLKGWRKMFKAEKQGRLPDTMRELAEFLTARGTPTTLEDVRKVLDESRRGKTMSLEASTSGDSGEEDEQTIGETLTASTSSSEEEDKIAQAQEQASLLSASAALSLEEQKFVQQYKRGFSVADIARRMGISKTKAFDIQKRVVAHLGGKAEG